MRRTPAPLLLCAALAACTPMQWVKPDASAEQLERDIAACRRQARQEARFGGWLDRSVGPRYLGDPLGERFMEESRLAHFCMRAKGYQLAPVEPKS